jgi:hypothetical protein
MTNVEKMILKRIGLFVVVKLGIMLATRHFTKKAREIAASDED